MKPAAVSQRDADVSAAAALPIRARVANAWLAALFAIARHAPWLIRALRPIIAFLVVAFSPFVRRNVAANARRLLPHPVPPAHARKFARQVVASFCDFILSIAQSAGKTPQQLRERIESTTGRQAYFHRRANGGGAVLVTAHMGSFELGLAALTQFEPNVHVVFKRDEFDGFESIRRELRRTLGVHEAPIDDGLTTLIRLRDALANDQVVVLQADRAMPGQKSQIVPCLGGHLRLPLGPIKLALAGGSPIIPVFSVMTSPTRCKIFIEPAIEVSPDNPDDALRQIGESIETFLARYPQQWLALHRAFVEDEST